MAFGNPLVVSATVVAQQFQLVNSAGVPIADLSAPAPFARLIFHHLDGATPIGDSRLTWTTNGGAQDQLRLEGPTAAGTLPVVNLVNGTAGGQAAIAYGSSAVSVQGNSVDDGISFQPGARGMNVNGRTARMEVAHAAVWNGTQVTMPFGVRAVLVGLVVAANAGDLIHGRGTVEVLSGNLSGIAQFSIFINGVQQTQDAAVQAPAGQRTATPTNELCGFVCPTTGNYTVEIQGYTYAAGVAYISNNAQISVYVMATN